MGARIAAHLANAGIWCALLDIAPTELTAEEQKRGLALASPEVRNRIVRAGLATAVKAKPGAFFKRGLENRIVTGNFEEDLKLCAEADWIIEVVAENLEIKRSLLSRVAQIRKPGTIVTTNTSGLPVRRIAEGIYEERAFDRMTILADALEKTGCDNPEILNHCRGPGPHVKGYWVVDLVLGKE